MLTDATQTLITAAGNTAASDAELNAAAQSFFDAVRQASVDDANAAIRTLSQHFHLDDAKRGAFLALICGALIEQGCDPQALARPITERIATLLESSAELGDACISQLPESADEDEDPNDAFEAIRQQVAATMPRQNDAWEALQLFWRPAIAVYSVSTDARVAARPLRDLAVDISDYHEAGHWLWQMLSVLDDEPILVIEPQTSLGILGRISGVVDNFQLNVLLMDGFPKSGLLPRRRVAKRVADVARGDGPQQSEDIVVGVWNLYTWQAIGPDLTLPNPADRGGGKAWIWNEGTPTDIPTFDGRRVVLLGPPSYQRSWRSQRLFDKLPASLNIEHKLSKHETINWLQRMAAVHDG